MRKKCNKIILILKNYLLLKKQQLFLYTHTALFIITHFKNSKMCLVVCCLLLDDAILFSLIPSSFRLSVF